MKVPYNTIEFDFLPSHVRQVINQILEREGSVFTNDKEDHPTRYGIRKLSADRAGYTGSIEYLDRYTAAQIWTSLFWYGPNIHLINEVSPLIAQTVVDTGGPAGIVVAIKHLQQAITSFNHIRNGKQIYGDDLTFDGLIGEQSLKQLELFVLHRKKKQGERKLATRLNCLQDAHYTAVAIQKPHKRKYSFGWNSQRVYADLMELADKTDTLIA